MNRNLLYNIVLASFAALMVGLSIVNGPPPTASPPSIATANPFESYIPLGIESPLQINWYELRKGTETIYRARDELEGWRDHEAPVADQQAAELGAALIGQIAVRQLFSFGPNDNLSEYGLTITPQFVVSFEIQAYNNKENFTLYIGTPTPAQQEYYAVFVDEVGFDPPRRKGEWVYLIQADYLDALFGLFQSSTVTPRAEP